MVGELQIHGVMSYTLNGCPFAETFVMFTRSMLWRVSRRAMSAGVHSLRADGCHR